MEQIEMLQTSLTLSILINLKINNKTIPYNILGTFSLYPFSSPNASAHSMEQAQQRQQQQQQQQQLQLLVNISTMKTN